MRRVVRSFAFAATAAALLTLVACTSSYHPEYHPVTVSNVSYPVMVNNGGSPAERSPVYVAPLMTALPPTLAASPAEQPPPGFFTHE